MSNVTNVIIAAAACQSGCGVLALGVCLAHAHNAVSQLRSIDCIPLLLLAQLEHQ